MNHQVGIAHDWGEAVLLRILVEIAKIAFFKHPAIVQFLQHLQLSVRIDTFLSEISAHRSMSEELTSHDELPDSRLRSKNPWLG